MNFQNVLLKENPLQIVGVINTYSGMLAEKAGFSAIYLSGAGIANACYGLPDLGLTSNTEVAEEIRRIKYKINLPLLVDADTGFGSVLNVARTVKLFEAAGANALHIEDQTWPKRCGHRNNKRLVSTQEMCDRVKAAVDARRNEHFSIMARTDAASEDGIDEALERAAKYREAGADMIFAEAVSELKHYELFVKQLKVPILANLTEFGKTPLFSLQELKSVGVQMALYPLSAFRAMNHAALQLYQSLKKAGTQKQFLDRMQTREELYQILDYKSDEDKIR